MIKMGFMFPLSIGKRDHFIMKVIPDWAIGDKANGYSLAHLRSSLNYSKNHSILIRAATSAM
jgi:hypothetical protein